MKHYIKLMRPHHYIKNFLVFAALACSGQFFDPQKLLSGCAGFAAFCLVSSVVYIINDIRDVEKDKRHPTKCRRPLPAGLVSLGGARILAVVLVVIAAVCNGLVFRGLSTALLAAYLVLNLGYSFGLKNVPIVDVTILVSGFLLRMFYGAIVTGIEVSSWLYMTVIAISFYFALGKRRNELKQLKTGDLLTFTDMDGEKILYEVQVIDVLQPTAVDTVKNSDFDLVLYTCTYGGESRVVVFCNRVKL